MKEKIAQELEIIELERSNLLKTKIEQHGESIRLSEQLKLIEQEKLNLLETQNSFLAEKLNLAEERERLTLEEERITQILQELEEEKRILAEAKHNIENDKKAVIEEREAVDEAWDEIEEKQESQTGGRRNKHPEEEYSQLFEEFQNQMANYTKDVEIREREIEVKNLAIQRNEEELDRKLAEIQSIEFSLLRAKHDIEELSLGTIPELESQSQHIQSILADLLLKRNEVDAGYIALQAKIDEFEKSKTSTKGNNKEITKLADELEVKLSKIKQREDELSVLESVLEKEKKENLSHALYLQKAQKEFDMNCAKKEAEIFEAKKRLGQLQSKLESAIMLMNTKENELISMKEAIMDEKNRMSNLDMASNKSRDTPLNE